MFNIIESERDSERIISYFVSKLKIELAQPEQVIIEQGTALNEDPNQNFFYIISKGECAIVSKDKAMFEDTQIKLLLPGDHFGEVALLYKCKRTATVLSNNYCTLGKMTERHFKDLLNKFPEIIEERFREIIYKYKDPITIFLLEAIDKIDYFRGVSEKVKRDIVYSLNPVNFDKGGLIFKPGDEADAMYIVDSGVVEIYTTMDKGVEFVIDRLYKGSVINHRAFLFNDVIDTYARCASLVSMFYIKIDDLSKIRERDQFVDTQISRIEESMVYRDNAVAIDYIICEPDNKIKKKRPEALHTRRNHLTHIFKNAVMYYFGKNREKRKKPNLSDILFAAVEKKKREMQAARKKKSNFDHVEKGNYLTDDEYEFVCEIIDKIYKVRNEHSLALETLQKKFELLLKMKPEAEVQKALPADSSKSKPKTKPPRSIIQNQEMIEENIFEEDRKEDEAEDSEDVPNPKML
jgi:CRP-like cAMP-binding protein